MRILFTSHLFYDNPGYSGGNWINALTSLLKEKESLEIGILYPSYSKDSYYVKDGINYFPIKIKLNAIQKIKNTFFTSAQLVKNESKVADCVNSFKPDIIQMFGLETIVTSIVKHVITVPIVVHIQGICEPCLEAWFPKGFSKWSVWVRYPFKLKMLRKTTIDKYYRFKNLAKVEQANYQCYHYYLGRTDWDKYLSRKYSPKRKYYVCNEVIRKEFYEYTWKQPQQLRLMSINNGELYKGFDTILLAANALKQKGLSFVWDVYGISADAPIVKIVEDILGYKFSECDVYFRGKKTATELALELSKATFYVHPSHVDNSPNSLCEAQIVGTPSISTNVGGIPSLVSDGNTGYLFNDGDYAVLSDIIECKCNADNELSNMSKNAKKNALERHDKRRIVDTLLKTYKEIIKDFCENENK